MGSSARLVSVLGGRPFSLTTDLRREPVKRAARPPLSAPDNFDHAINVFHEQEGTASAARTSTSTATAGLVGPSTSSRRRPRQRSRRYETGIKGTSNMMRSLWGGAAGMCAALAACLTSIPHPAHRARAGGQGVGRRRRAQVSDHGREPVWNARLHACVHGTGNGRRV